MKSADSPSTLSRWPAPIRFLRSLAGRFLRWLVRWRTLRALGFGFLCLLTLIALFYAVEDWRGQRAWKQYRQELEARGESLDLASFLPKPVPRDQNFAKTPFLAPLMEYEFVNGAIRWRDSNAVNRVTSISEYAGGDHNADDPPTFGNWESGEFCDLRTWQKFFRGGTNAAAWPPGQEPARDVLRALQIHEPILAELRTASQRPYAVFINSDDNTAFGPLKHLSVLRRLARICNLRAAANLQAGQSAEALGDTQLAFHFAHSLESEPMLISLLVRMVIIKNTLQPVWEGLARHRWTDAQLQELQKSLESIDFLPDYLRGLRFERALISQHLEETRSGNGARELFPSKPLRLLGELIPSGWYYQNELTLARSFQQYLDPVDAEQRRVHPDKSPDWAMPKLTPYGIIARMVIPKLSGRQESLAATQVEVDLARIACALERFRLAEGRYPETLDALVPRFLATVPKDIIGGNPLKYQRDDGGHFVLYSVGWNQQDDGGSVAGTRSNPQQSNFEKADWVWPRGRD